MKKSLLVLFCLLIIFILVAEAATASGKLILNNVVKII